MVYHKVFIQGILKVVSYLSLNRLNFCDVILITHIAIFSGIDPTSKPANGETGGGANIDPLGDLFGATPAAAATTTSKDDVSFTLSESVHSHSASGIVQLFGDFIIVKSIGSVFDYRCQINGHEPFQLGVC